MQNLSNTINNIEDTIFSDSMPTNPIPVLNRLLELVKEKQSNDPKVLMRDLRIRKCYWLLREQFQTRGNIKPNQYDEFQKIKELAEAQTIEMDFDEWWEKYRPTKNALSNREEYDGCLFETYGRDLEFIQKTDHNDKLWTLVESDGNLYIMEGYHTVNRIGYFFTEKSYDPKNTYNIKLY